MRFKLVLQLWLFIFTSAAKTGEQESINGVRFLNLSTLDTYLFFTWMSMF